MVVSKNFGIQDIFKVYEKLISGMYLGELFRQVTYSLFLNIVYILLCSEVLLEAVNKRLLFPGVDVKPVLNQRDCLQTRHISAIESDEAGEYASTWAVLQELGLEKQATTMDCRVVRCFILISFSASLSLSKVHC